MEIDINQLKSQAKTVSDKAYAPYSKFAVGCIIVSGKGNIYSGCNVENISFGLTNCAERTAIFKGVSEEGHEFSIKQVVIYTPTNGYVGLDSFTYTVDDGRGGTDRGAVKTR